MSEARDIFARSLELMEAGEVGKWVDLFAPDGVLEIPFPLPGLPDRIAGTDALREYMAVVPQQLKLKFGTPTYHLTEDPGVVVVELTSEGTALATDTRFHQRYVSIVTVREGKITLFRDYWNPWIIIEAVGGPEAFAKASGG